MNDTQNVASGDLEPETVSALLDEARWRFEEERAEGARLDTRLAVLTGFAGLILALVAPTFGSPFSGGSGVFFDIFYVASLLFLALAALLPISVLFGMRIFWLDGERVASPGRAGAGAELLEGLSGRWGAEPATQVERRITAGLVAGIEEQQARNDLRWTRFRFAALALAMALLLIVSEAVLMFFAW
jgi:hypothetical protein